MTNKNDSKSNTPKVPLQNPYTNEVGGSVNIPTYERAPSPLPVKKDE